MELTDDATVDDALSLALGRIGDVRITKRTDLPNNWLLCNGETYNGDDYPLYRELFGETEPFETINQTQITDPTSSRVYSHAYYINDYMIICGGIGSNAYIWYKKANETEWTSKLIFSASTYGYLNGLIYADGKYVVFGHECNNSTETIGVYYSSTLDGQWTHTSIQTIFNYTNYGVTSVAFVDGKWFVIYNISTNGPHRCAISNDITSTSWLITDINLSPMGLSGRILDVKYCDGKLVGTFWGANGFNPVTYSYGLVYSFDGITWDYRTFHSSTTESRTSEPSMDYDAINNQYWLSLPLYSSNYFRNMILRIDHTFSNVKTFTTYAVSNSNASECFAGEIKIIRGNVYVPIKEVNATKYSIWISDGNNAFTSKTVGTPSWRSSEFTSIAYGNGTFYGTIMETQYLNSNVYFSLQVITSPIGVKMPTVTSDGAYAYIRAK